MEDLLAVPRKPELPLRKPGKVLRRGRIPSGRRDTARLEELGDEERTRLETFWEQVDATLGRVYGN